MDILFVCYWSHKNFKEHEHTVFCFAAPFCLQSQVMIFNVNLSTSADNKFFKFFPSYSGSKWKLLTETTKLNDYREKYWLSRVVGLLKICIRSKHVSGMHHKVLLCYDWLKKWEACEWPYSQGDCHIKCG